MIMSSQDWRWKISEAIQRIRTRYDHIGRKTGAPFLAVVYPPEAEKAAQKEWHDQASTLSPEFDVRFVNALEITQQIIADIGPENIVSALREPMPGSDPEIELGNLWITAVSEAIRNRFSDSGGGKPVVTLEKVSAFYPACGPRDVMQELWGNVQSSLEGPVVVLIPGHIEGPRTYSFLGKKAEFMYRGDLI